MDILDMRTVIFVNVITDVVCLLVVVILWFQNKNRLVGTGFWVMDYIFQTTGMVLIILRGIVPDWMSMTLANTLVVAGAVLGFIGLERFVGKKSSQVHNYILLVVFAGIHTVFSYVQPSLAVRNLNLSFGLLIVCFQCAWLMFHRVSHSMRRLTRGVGVVFGAYCLVSIIRIVEIIISPKLENDLYRSGTYEVLIIIAYQMLLILLVFSLTLMVNRRLLMEVQNQEEKFTKAFHSSPYAITLTRLSDGNIFEVNEGFLDITGYRFDEVVGRSTLDIPLWEKEQDRSDVANWLAQDNVVKGLEFRFRKKSGERLIGLFSAEIIIIDGQLCVLSSIMDITERKEVEQALRDSENEMRALFAAMIGVVIVYDADGRYIKIAPTNPSYLYRPPNEMLGKTVHDVLPKVQADYLVAKIGEAIKTGEVVIGEYSLPIGGKEIWFACSISRLSENTAILVAHDFTEYKQIQQELQESETRLRELFISMSSGAALYEAAPKGEDFYFKDFNQAAERIDNVAREDIIGRSVLETFPEVMNFGLFEVFQRVWRTGEPEHHPISYYKDNRISGWRENYVFKLNSGEIVTIYDDITARKQAEKLQEAILRIAQASIASDGIDTLYHSIHAILGELIQAQNFFIALYDPDNGLISFPYYVDEYDEPPLGPTPIEGLTGYVIRTGRPLLATQETFEWLVQQGEVEEIGTKSVDWMGAPLKVGGRIIGVITVQSYKPDIHFNQDDLNLLEFVSTQVAQAIERVRLVQEIHNLSITDELTGLHNRRGFTLLAEQELRLAQRYKRSGLLLYGDVDDLKTINDTWGHPQGDQALKDISAILKETLREADIAARIGGDEFVVLAVGAAIENAETIVNHIQDALERHNQQEGQIYQLSLSIGIAHYDPEALCTVSELIARADDMMYRQKNSRKGNK